MRRMLGRPALSGAVHPAADPRAGDLEERREAAAARKQRAARLSIISNSALIALNIDTQSNVVTGTVDATPGGSR